jgi:zinc transport system ATP-binding protein
VIAADADLAVLDEPTASMDAAAERATYHRLAELVRERRLSVMVVTHTVAVALAHADRVLYVERDDGGGRVVLDTPRALAVDPAFAHAFPAISAALSREVADA